MQQDGRIYNQDDGGRTLSAAGSGQDAAAAGLPVVTLTLNPCIDRTIRVPNLECGGTNHVTDAREDVAGKGINVSIALRQLGVETVCLGFSYSEDAARLERALEERGIAYDFVAVNGKLRVNLKVFDESQRVMTEFNERGGRVPAEAVDRLLAKVDRYLDRAALIVLTGSVPEGVPNGIYGTIIRMAHKKGVRAVLDASGALLAEGLREKPFLIKPNRDEFMGLFGEELAAGKRVEEIAREVVAQGVDYVCVSMGAEGCVLAGADGVLAADAPDVEVRGIQGAGDSLVAGMCAALVRDRAGVPGGLDREKMAGGAGASAQSELLRCAVAAAGASLMRPGTQMCTREDFLALYDRVKIRPVQ